MDAEKLKKLRQIAEEARSKLNLPEEEIEDGLSDEELEEVVKEASENLDKEVTNMYDFYDPEDLLIEELLKEAAVRQAAVRQAEAAAVRQAKADSRKAVRKAVKAIAKRRRKQQAKWYSRLLSKMRRHPALTLGAGLGAGALGGYLLGGPGTTKTAEDVLDDFLLEKLAEEELADALDDYLDYDDFDDFDDYEDIEDEIDDLVKEAASRTLSGRLARHFKRYGILYGLPAAVAAGGLGGYYLRKKLEQPRITPAEAAYYSLLMGL